MRIRSDQLHRSPGGNDWSGVSERQTVTNTKPPNSQVFWPVERMLRIVYVVRQGIHEDL